MSDEPQDPDLDDLKRRMDGAMAALRAEFGTLRIGRASGTMLEPVQVDAYGHHRVPKRCAWNFGLWQGLPN